jgi:2'-5' RNA ligase
MVELSTSFEAAWERFQALDSLQLAGDSVELEQSHGRAQLLAFLVRIEDSAVRRHAEGVLGRLTSIPGIEPYPPEYWHITVKLAGYQVIKRTREDDVLRQEVGRLGREAAALLGKRPAYPARIGLPNAFPDALILEVRDEAVTGQINTLLLEGLGSVASNPFDGASFLPHISIARFTSNAGLDQLKATLAELRAEGPGPEFPVRRVEFVKAWLSDETPEFETLASYPLSAS